MTVKELESLIQEQHISILSFDIFDTLIKRPFEKPTDVFAYMANSLPLVPKNFPQCRVEAERLARRSAPGGECNMSEIYAELEKMDGYDTSLCKTLCSMEKETELRICEPRPEGAELLLAAKKLDVRVILISDMYLSRLRISRMLCKCGLKNFAELYISSEHRQNKANGDLFRYVRKCEELPFSSFLHIGDNPISDVIIPRNLGMHALYLPKDGASALPAETGIDRFFPYGTRRRKLAAGVLHFVKRK